MSSGDTIYTARAAYPEYLERERTQTVQLAVYRDGSLVAPSSGTLSLYDTGGSLMDSGAVTVTDSIATYEITSAVLDSDTALGRGYRLVWELTLDSVERSYRRDASVVLSAPVPVVTDADITSVYTDLAQHRRHSSSTWQGYIDEAWKRILGRLEGEGVFPECVFSSWSLRECHLELTLHLVTLDYARAQGGRWTELYAHHLHQYHSGWRKLRFLRASGDEVADSTDMHSAQRHVTHMGGAPRTMWGGGFGLW